MYKNMYMGLTVGGHVNNQTLNYRDKARTL